MQMHSGTSFAFLPPLSLLKLTKMSIAKPSFLTSILSPLTGADKLALEKARLEAFLNAFPGEYCGFHEDGTVAYSDGFRTLLNLPEIKTIEDIQSTLETSDSAALEGLYLKLEENGTPFSLLVRTTDGHRILRLRGAAGAAINGEDRFRIIWLEDVSEEEENARRMKLARETLERELGQMQGGLETLPIPVWIRDGNADLVWVNQAYAQMLGTTPAEVIISQYEITLSPKNKGLAPKDMAREALKEGVPKSSDSHLIVQGKRKLMHLAEMPLPGTGNALGYARDMTREEELQAELTRYLSANKSLLEQLRSGIAIFGQSQQLEFFNSSFSQLWGLEDQWLNGKPRLGDLLEKLRENRRLPEQADFRNYKQGWLDMFTRLIDPHEDMLYLPDGSAVRLLVVPHPLGGLMMTFEDVTSRLELESSYNTLIAVQKETLDNLAEAVVVYGGDGRIRLWNPAFSQLWALNPEDLNGNPHISKLSERMSPFFGADWADKQKNKLIELGLDRNESKGRMPVRTDGIHLSYATMPLPDGGVMVSFYDITDSALVETALRDKNEALEAADQLKTDFIANVSYQLRTPLNTIMGFSEILDNQYFGPLNERQQEYTKGIHEAGERLANLIDDILDLASIEAGYLELKKEPVNIGGLLNGLYDLTKEWARKRKIAVKIFCPPSIPQISADERRLKQAILNLIRNAINFSPEGGNIEISAIQSGDRIDITIQDSGIGIPEEDLARIFQPFERLQHAGKQAGAGLGLSLVKNIIELHNGVIEIDSEEGKGTKVRLILPIA
jgi:signal transduction histidine kinase